MYFLPAIFGLLVGATVGFAIVYAMPALLVSLMVRSIAGGTVGAIFGAVIGSVTSDPNASTEAGGHRILVAGFFGIIGGVLGASKLEIIWETLHLLKLPSPF